MTFPLPFVIQSESRCGTVEQAVWVSDQAWQPGRLEVNNETDQQFGGILTTMKVRLAPAPVSATSHG